MADPAPLSFKTRGGGGGAGLGGVAYKDRARPPPRGLNTQHKPMGPNLGVKGKPHVLKHHLVLI